MTGGISFRESRATDSWQVDHAQPAVLKASSLRCR